MKEPAVADSKVEPKAPPEPPPVADKEDKSSATAHGFVASDSRRKEANAPATQPGNTERVDLVIIVRADEAADPNLELRAPDRRSAVESPAVSPAPSTLPYGLESPATQPSATRPGAPTTQP
jgi:hypothetical protein